METKASVFFERIKDKKIAFIGLGRTHKNLIKMFDDKKMNIKVYDIRTKEEIGEDICNEFEKRGIPMVLGPKYMLKLGKEDIIFRTPKLSYNTPELKLAHRAGQIITSETEVFFDLCPCKTIGVTGSDGKKVTSLLIADMLRASGNTVHLGGTVGDVLLSKIDNIHPQDYVVASLDAPQLVSMRTSPDIAVITDISRDYSVPHMTFEEYVEAKKNIFIHQGGFSTTVLNSDNPITCKFANIVRGIPTYFSKQAVVQRGAWIDRCGDIWYSDNDSQTLIMNEREINPQGIRTRDYYLAAFSALWGIVDMECMIQVAKEFVVGENTK